jgi:hypothetical protein
MPEDDRIAVKNANQAQTDFCHQTDDPFAVQKLAGHSDVLPTMQTYAHVQAETLRKATGVLDRIGLFAGGGVDSDQTQTTVRSNRP